MKLRISVLIAVILSATLALAAPTAQQSYDQLKSLTGQWEGKAMNKGDVKVSFRMLANGSSLVSEIDGVEDNMISVIHLDGDRLLLTHYCGAGNQPRMAVTSADGKSITFDMVDATNLLPSQPGHMHRVIITMLDANHHTEEWVFAGKDGKEIRESFDLQRKQ